MVQMEKYEGRSPLRKSKSRWRIILKQMERNRREGVD
jgi:hypothetical protein